MSNPKKEKFSPWYISTLLGVFMLIADIFFLPDRISLQDHIIVGIIAIGLIALGAFKTLRWFFGAFFCAFMAIVITCIEIGTFRNGETTFTPSRFIFSVIVVAVLLFGFFWCINKLWPNRPHLILKNLFKSKKSPEQNKFYVIAPDDSIAQAYVPESTSPAQFAVQNSPVVVPELTTQTSDALETNIPVAFPAARAVELNSVLGSAASMEDLDELLPAAIEIVLEVGQASVSMLQRRLKLGYGRAARLVDQMETLGLIGPFEGSTPREVYTYNGKEIANALSDFQKKAVNVQKIIQNEMQWRAEQGGVATAHYELEEIDSMEGHEFEHWCADLLRKIGFQKVTVTQGSGDQGVDILAEKDGIRYAIQCKCYSSDLGNKPIQEVNTGKAIYHCHVGAVITNRHFTPGGKQAAEATGVLLWDRDWIMSKL